MPPHLTSPLLTHPRLSHGFFGRQGGISEGYYASLNASLSSADDPAHVAGNRLRVQTALGAAELYTLHQVHGAEVVTLTAPLAERPKADGMVTTTPNLALGVLTADCNPVLFADADAGVIGACHAGWQGALAGVALATLDAMKQLGATRITAVLGPAIQQKSYEVGADLRDRFIAQDPAHLQFFLGKRDGKFLFDLPGYLEEQLIATGITVDRLFEDTYSQPEAYFSHRRATHLSEPHHGNQIAAIMLRG